MTFLADVEIRSVLNKSDVSEEKRIEITPPPDDKHIGPCSVDLRLGREFARLRKRPRYFGFLPFDPTRHDTAAGAQDTWYKYFTVSEERGFLLRPNETVVAETKEWVKLPRSIFGLVTGRSSYSRIGLEIQLTQDLRQPGHAGRILLQLKNNAPFAIKVYPGMRIAQIMLARLGEPCSTGYDQAPTSKYKGETDGIATKWFLDDELKGRNLISRQLQIESLLNAGLLIATAVTVWTLYSAGSASPATIGLIAATALVLAARTFVYFRSK